MTAYTPPDIRPIIAGLTKRVELLERRIRETATIDTAWELTFSYAGALTATESPPALVPRSSVLNVLAVAFGTAGSTSTTLEVKRDGATVATITVPSSTTTYNADVGVTYDAEQKLSVEITSVGTGASDMTAMARFS